MIALLGGETNIHVPWVFSLSNSSCIAVCHCTLAEVVLKFLGSWTIVISIKNENPPKKESSICKDVSSSNEAKNAT